MADQTSSAQADEPLRRLAQRLLSLRFPGMMEQEAELLVGALPADLPVEVPLPEGAQILGSLLQGEMGIQIVLEVEQPAAEVLVFYRRALEAAGWKAANWPQQLGGFHPGDPGVVFCRGRRGPELRVSVHDRAGTPADMRLHLQSDPRHVSCGRPLMFGSGGVPASPLPQLKAPAGAKAHPSSGGGGGNTWYSAATVETALDAATLAVHYRDQLQAAGWELQAWEAAQAMARSTWRFTDDEGDRWTGTLLVADVAGPPDRRLAYLYAEWVA